MGVQEAETCQGTLKISGIFEVFIAIAENNQL